MSAPESQDGDVVVTNSGRREMPDAAFQALFGGLVVSAKAMSDDDRLSLADEMTKAADEIRKANQPDDGAGAAGEAPTQKAEGDTGKVEGAAGAGDTSSQATTEKAKSTDWSMDLARR